MRAERNQHDSIPGAEMCWRPYINKSNRQELGLAVDTLDILPFSCVILGNNFNSPAPMHHLDVVSSAKASEFDKIRKYVERVLSLSSF